MKKLLIAAAAMTAVAGVAQAQSSSVTLYGALGFSTNQYKTDGVNQATQNANRKQDWLGTTALGIMGTEDLGGGMSAFFKLEGDLAPTGNLGESTSSTASTSIFNRHAHVGFKTNYGTLTAGRQNDSIKDLEVLGQVSNLSDNLHMNTQVGDRYSNAVKYATPTWNGLSATYTYSNNPITGDSADAGNGVQTLNSYAVSYVNGNYNLGAGKGKITKADAVAGAAAGVAGDLETTFLGARATFGSLTVGAHYAKNEQGVAKANQTMVSANYTMGNVDLKAHYVKDDADGTNGLTKIDGKGYGVMGVYNFSKRTAVYAAYADYDRDAANNAGDQKLTTVGIFHKF